MEKVYRIKLYPYRAGHQLRFRGGVSFDDGENFYKYMFWPYRDPISGELRMRGYSDENSTKLICYPYREGNKLYGRCAVFEYICGDPCWNCEADEEITVGAIKRINLLVNVSEGVVGEACNCTYYNWDLSLCNSQMQGYLGCHGAFGRTIFNNGCNPPPQWGDWSNDPCQPVMQDHLMCPDVPAGYSFKGQHTWEGVYPDAYYWQTKCGQKKVWSCGGWSPTGLCNAVYYLGNPNWCDIVRGPIGCSCGARICTLCFQDDEDEENFVYRLGIHVYMSYICCNSGSGHCPASCIQANDLNACAGCLIYCGEITDAQYCAPPMGNYNVREVMSSDGVNPALGCQRTITLTDVT